jgi:hypothetical protein
MQYVPQFRRETASKRSRKQPKQRSKTSSADRKGREFERQYDRKRLYPCVGLCKIDVKSRRVNVLQTEDGAWMMMTDVEVAPMSLFSGLWSATYQSETRSRPALSCDGKGTGITRVCGKIAMRWASVTLCQRASTVSKAVS